MMYGVIINMCKFCQDEILQQDDIGVKIFIIKINNNNKIINLNIYLGYDELFQGGNFAQV